MRRRMRAALLLLGLLQAGCASSNLTDRNALVGPFDVVSQGSAPGVSDEAKQQLSLAQSQCHKTLVEADSNDRSSAAVTTSLQVAAGAAALAGGILGAVSARNKEGDSGRQTTQVGAFMALGTSGVLFSLSGFFPPSRRYDPARGHLEQARAVLDSRSDATLGRDVALMTSMLRRCAAAP